MKLSSYISNIIQHFLIFVLFLIPPLFITGKGTTIYTQWNFPLNVLIYSVCSLLILIVYKSNLSSLKIKKSILYKVTSSFICLALLISVAWLIDYLSPDTTTINVVLPDTLLKWIFCILNFLLAAFYEEIMYRLYAPEILYNLISRFYSNKITYIFCELIACALFAFAHRNSGLLSVLNGAFAYILLRINIKKTGSVAANTTVHFVYNLIQLFLLTK